ncbi:ArgE/DapE family deacylase [Weissella cibaria]|uniref:ArgE/DapE family deacylase n=1 Tax=Weissella cibaria TaxID=137591 RepID=UPI00211EB34D|nr:ArgE/DapE family deacylase [Weissella cibaria]MCQ9619925.1 ArgE/DapE family deacylase [Weissella cibaria]
MNTFERIAILEKSISIKTDGHNEQELAEYLKKILKDHNIESTEIPFATGRSNLIVSMGHGDRILGLTGHMDTVNTGPLSDWKSDPLVLTDVEGKLFGRGTSDMKGGLVALIIALIEIKDEGIDLGGQIRLLATGGEEKGQLGSASLLGHQLISDLEALIVAEPSRLVNHQSGTSTQFAIFGQNGVLDFEVISKGKSAHSSMPELGINAIDNLQEYMNQQKKYFDEMAGINDSVLGKIIPVNSIISGGEQINSVPAYAKLTTKVRTTTTVNSKRIITDLKNIIREMNKFSDINLEFNVLRQLDPVVTSKDSPIIKLVSMYGQEFFKQKINLRTVAGTTDAATFISENNRMDIVQIGPGNDSSHMANEYIFQQDFLDYIDFIKKIIISYLND